MFMQRKAFSLRKQPPSFRAIYLLLSFLPLVILLGNTGTAMQILCILLVHDEIFGDRKLASQNPGSLKIPTEESVTEFLKVFSVEENSKSSN